MWVGRTAVMPGADVTQTTPFASGASCQVGGGVFTLALHERLTGLTFRGRMGLERRYISMRKFMLLFVLVALAVPVAALASGTPTAASTANRICKLAQTSMGATLFAQTYATNASKTDAFGKCVSQAVSKSVAAQAKTLTTAATSCKAALKASATDFATKYGTGRDAFGKCVAATSKTK